MKVDDRPTRLLNEQAPRNHSDHYLRGRGRGLVWMAAQVESKTPRRGEAGEAL
jgi:hypothetical protein